MKLKSTIIELPYATITFRKEGFIYLHYKGCLLTLEESKTIFSITRNNSPWKKCPLLISEDDFSAQDKDSRLFNESTDVAKHCSAKAFIVKNAAQKIVYNFSVKMFRAQMPVRCFLTEEDAVEWLKVYMPFNELVASEEEVC